MYVAVALLGCAAILILIRCNGDGTSGSTAATSTVGSNCPGPSLLVDCGFESPVVPVGGFQLFSVDGDVSGWKVIGAAGNVAPLSTAYANGRFSWPAHEGNQTLDLTGLSNTATGVSQIVSTKSATTYKLSFWVGNIANPGGPWGISSSVTVLVDGSQILEAVNSDGAGENSLSWKLFTMQFTATSSTTTIAFVNGDPSTDETNIIDQVELIALH